MYTGPTLFLGRWCWLVVLVFLLAVSPKPAVVDAEVVTFGSAEDAYVYAVQLFTTDGMDASRAALEQLLAVAPSHAASIVALGTIYGMQGNLPAQRHLFESALIAGTVSSDIYNNLGYVYEQLGRVADARAAYRRAIDADPANPQPYINLALECKFRGDLDEAIAWLEQGAKAVDTSANLMFNLGVMYQTQGAIIAANKAYNRALAIDPKYPEPRMNVAALHHRYGDVEQAVEQYQILLALPELGTGMETNLRKNLAQAYLDLGDVAASLAEYSKSLRPDSPFQDRVDTAAHVSRTRRVVADWVDYETSMGDIFAGIDALWKEIPNHPSALLPFDSLLLQVPPQWRLRVAQLHSAQWNHLIPDAESRPRPELLPPVRPHGRPRLSLGYMTADYTDHPTAHLVEGLFVKHNRDLFRVAAYSYGRDDESAFRQRIVGLADAFSDMVTFTFKEIAEAIRQDACHILLDMQVHTRKTREAVVAMRPAVLQVNYLVYPGTSGAPFLDFVIVDRVVVPPEHAGHYSEALVILPRCYQVNYFVNILAEARKSATDSDGMQGGHHLGAPMDRQSVYHLPPLPTQPGQPRSAVFVNFNKVDKHEPHSFRLFLEVLRQVPGSVLWMLTSKKKYGQLLRDNLRNEARAHGVHADRIIFAPFVSKLEHLRRHVHGDLFLDASVYGAHSTATDALRAGLPVLTQQGDQWPARVASSLLLNAGLPMLTTYSRKAFVDAAVRLCGSPAALASLRAHLQAPTGVPRPLFDTMQHVKDLEHAYHAMWEASQAAGAASRWPHVVVAE